MRRSLLRLICCPQCHSALEITAVVEEELDQIVTGTLTCAGCNATFPILRGVPRFVPNDAYTTSFSYEWNAFPHTQFGEQGHSDEDFRIRGGLPPEFATGKTVLDAGCGAGRHVEHIAPHAAELVAFDLSLGVDVCYANEGWRPNLHVVQAAIGNLPFKPATFDFIYCIGVIQHTPDARRSFLSLVPYLRDGGTIAAWVFSGHDNTSYFMSDKLRKITTRLPKESVHALARLAIPLYYLYRIKPLKPILQRIFLISTHPNPEWRVLDTFNWYTPRYQTKHTYQEMYEWFREAGIERVGLSPHPVGMHGSKLSSTEA